VASGGIWALVSRESHNAVWHYIRRCWLEKYPVKVRRGALCGSPPPPGGWTITSTVPKLLHSHMRICARCAERRERHEVRQAERAAKI